MLKLPVYIPPDFSKNPLISASCVTLKPATADRLLPENFYATTIYPEYFKIDGKWCLIEAPRMDCAVVIDNGTPHAVEARPYTQG
jgi:hypothetical protein